ncbi:MSCRAMM family protein [Nonlabens arenilitoris]|nr:SdrD B-like domain-containing protein [Nonlabens arenilitoris]
MKNYINNFKLIGLSMLAMFVFSCDGNEVCGYTGDDDPDCPNLQANIGDACDSNGNGMLDGTINEFCECIGDSNLIPTACDLSSELNLTSGIDNTGMMIPAAFGAVDPFWKVLNRPPLINGNNPANPCNSPAVAPFNGDVFSMNLTGQPDTGWVNQPGAATLAPFDLGPNGSFNCNNAQNSAGQAVPFVFERAFCVLEDTAVDFSFTFEGDDEIFFELLDSNNNVLSTSPVYDWSPNTGIQTWSATALALPADTYSIRGYLLNTGSVILGFSFLGNMVTTNGDMAISNNNSDNEGNCCENNTISILNILEGINSCDRAFNDASDAIGDNWTFEVLDSNNNVIRIGTTDINGNYFFSGLADGNYTIRIINQTGWTQTVTTETVSLANNSIELITFYSCPN